MNKRAKLERMADYEELDKDIEARHCMFALKNHKEKATNSKLAKLKG